MMRALPPIHTAFGLLLLGLSCQGKGPPGDDSGTVEADADTDADSDADTDSDADADADADSDTDSDADCDADPYNMSDSWVQVSIGDFHACGLKRDGSLRCWGEDVMDAGATSPPPGQYGAVSSGTRASCAIRSDGTIACWGISMGDPPTSGPYIDISVPNGPRRCAVRASGEIDCWGDVVPERDIPSGTDFIDVEVSQTVACGLTRQGEIVCAGENNNGDTEVPRGWTWIDVGAGVDFACGITDMHEIVCWGSDYSRYTTESPLDAPAGEFIRIDSGDYGSCALSTDGTVACWGAFSDYPYQSPVGLGPFVYVDRGDTSAVACAIAEDSSMSCWGYNDYGQCCPPED